jgi:hypothetical protein
MRTQEEWAADRKAYPGWLPLETLIAPKSYFRKAGLRSR